MSHHHRTRRNSALEIEIQRRQANRRMATILFVGLSMLLISMLFGGERSNPEGPSSVLSAETIGETVSKNPLRAYAEGFADRHERQIEEAIGN